MEQRENTQSPVNNTATSSQMRAPVTQSRSRPVRYELVSYRGETFGPYDSVEAVVAAAKAKWPDQSQDEDRTGKGWDVQIEGCK